MGKSARAAKIPQTIKHDKLEYSTLRGGWHQPTYREEGAPSARFENLRHGAKQRIYGMREGPIDKHLIKSARSDDSWASDLHRMKKQDERVERVRNADNDSLESDMPDYLKQLVDIDGDGVIDHEEMQLMTELENVEVRDLDGDGNISAEEIMLAKKMAGKKLLAKHFVDRQHGRMWRYDQFLPGVGEKSARTQTKTIADARNFGTLMKALKIRESRYHLSSSDLVDGCLHQSQRWSQRGTAVTASVAGYLN